jgi:hypothetical protein|nr:hypothetical protein [Mycolicibacter sinensis]
MQELRCDRCGTPVLVEKYSPTHTSVQWLTDAKSACAEFARRAAAGECSRWTATCPALRDSIDRAVDAGVIPVDSQRCEPNEGG